MVMNLFDYSSITEVAPWMMALIIIVAVWDMIWKLFAVWKSARKGSPVWFVVLFLFNTAGILPILYIFVFSKMNLKGKASKRKKR